MFHKQNGLFQKSIHLRSADEIAIDLETRDPDLKSKGSGAITGNGEIVGFAVAVNGYKNYFPIAHGQDN